VRRAARSAARIAADGPPRARRPRGLGERRSHLLVGGDSGGREVPRPPLAIDRRGQRAVRCPLFGGGQRAIGDRAEQRVAEREPAVGDGDQPGRLRGLERAQVEPRGGELVERAGLARRRDRQCTASGLGQRVEPVAERPLDAGADRHRLLDRFGAAALGLAQQTRQLEQRQWVAAGRAEQPRCDLAGDRAALLQQRRRRGSVEPAEHQLGHARRLASDRLAGPRREQQHNPLLLEPAGDEHERLARRRVEPRSVVDGGQHGRALGRRGEQTQRRRVEREAIARHRRPEREGARERRALRRRQ
jgi:hypothetical protein